MDEYKIKKFKIFFSEKEYIILRIYIDMYYKVRCLVEIHAFGITASSVDFKKSISPKTGKLRLKLDDKDYILPKEIILPEKYREEVCDYLEQLKRVSEYMTKMYENKKYGRKG